jgi:N-acetylglucosamine malate deacetylase 1
MPAAWFIGAHPDDAEIYALGLLLQLQQAGWSIGWVIVTDGAAARGVTDLALAQQRLEEARQAAAACSAALRTLGLPDGTLGGATDPRPTLAPCLSALGADLLITHHPNDYHADHRAVSQAVAGCLTPGQSLLYAEPMLGMGPLPDVWIDITTVFDAKLAALAYHASQTPEQFGRHLTTWAEFRALQIRKPGVTRAEAFSVARDHAFQKSPVGLLPQTCVTLAR